MLSLPSKPWKKVRIDALEGQCFRIAFLTDMPTESAFHEAIENDIAPCLGKDDRLDSPDWSSRSVVVTTSDLRALKRKLVFASVMVELK